MNIIEETNKELKKCIEEPWYFYNKYIKIEGIENKREITKEEWEQILKLQRFDKHKRNIKNNF